MTTTNEPLAEVKDHRLYAGCDADGRVGLFNLVDGEPRSLTTSDWLRVLKAWGCSPVQMFVVHLTPAETEER